MSANKIVREKLDKTLQKKELAIKPITQSLVDLERSAICLQTEISLLITTIAELHSWSSKTTASGGGITNNLRKYITPEYFTLESNEKNAILTKCSKEVSELAQFISELERSWNRRSKYLAEFKLVESVQLRLKLRFCFKNSNRMRSISFQLVLLISDSRKQRKIKRVDSSGELYFWRVRLSYGW